MSAYAAEIFAGDAYYSDDCRFGTRDEALAYARSRTSAAYRATLTGDDVNYCYWGGRLAPSTYTPPELYGHAKYFP